MDKVKNKEWLENEFESAFDDNTAPTGGGYEADYTDKWGFYRKFEPCIIEYATQQSRIDAIGFAEWVTGAHGDLRKIYSNNGDGQWVILTPTPKPQAPEIISTEKLYELYLLSINKK